MTGINSVDHAMRLLALLAEDTRPLTVSEMGRQLVLPRPTIYRLLTTLSAHRAVFHDSKGYRLGFQLLRLGEAARAHTDPGEIARPLLEDLVRQSGETAHFGVLDDDRICYVTKIDSSHPIRMLSSIGWRGPLHACGGGKVLLAFSDPALLDRIAASPLERFTPKTIVDPDRLREHVATVRRQGYGEDLEELLEGLTCIAAPVVVTRRLVGVVSISGPPARMAPRDRLRAMVCQAAERFAALLGGNIGPASSVRERPSA
jgi:IclR family acetate operon transcriptional repressor